MLELGVNGGLGMETGKVTCTESILLVMSPKTLGGNSAALNRLFRASADGRECCQAQKFDETVRGCYPMKKEGATKLAFYEEYNKQGGLYGRISNT